MIVEFDKSFFKSLARVNDKSILAKVKNNILALENSHSLPKLKNLKKLTGFKRYYRIKIGDYRLGFERIDKETIRLILISHRKDIYRKFP